MLIFGLLDTQRARPHRLELRVDDAHRRRPKTLYVNLSIDARREDVHQETIDRAHRIRSAVLRGVEAADIPERGLVDARALRISLIGGGEPTTSSSPSVSPEFISRRKINKPWSN